MSRTADSASRLTGSRRPSANAWCHMRPGVVLQRQGHASDVGFRGLEEFPALRPVEARRLPGLAKARLEQDVRLRA